MKKTTFLKTLLMAAGLGVGANGAWADGVTMPTPVYTENFESASISEATFTGSNSESGTLTGTGEIATGDPVFGKYYQNKPTTIGVRANYLKINSTAFQTASIATNKAVTLSFWVSTTYQLNNSLGTPAWNAMFEAFTTDGFTTAAGGGNGYVTSHGAFDIRTNTSSHALFANYYYHNTYDSNPAYKENTSWMTKGWHHIAYVLADDEGKTHLNFYIDGVLNTNVDLAQSGEGTLWANLADITNYVLGGCSAEWADGDVAFGYDEIALYDQALTIDQVNQIIDNKAAIKTIPSSFDYSSTTASLFPFRENAEIKTGGGNTALTLSKINSTSTAWVDTDTDKDGRQAYEIASNEKITATFNVYCGWNASNSTQTVALINDGGYTLASFKYGTSSTTIEDVKIGGVTPTGFSVSPSINNGNGFDKWTSAVVPQVVTITISGSRYVTLNVVNTTKSVNWSVSGTIDNASIEMNLAKITYSYSNANFNNNRSMAIKSLALSTETVSEANVTYKYVDTSDNDLSALVADKVTPTSIGATIDDELIPASYKTSFLSGDENTKYVYSTFTSSDETVQAGGSTVTLKFAPKAKFTYTKRAKCGDDLLNATLATGYAYEGETVTLSWPKYIQIDGKWYVTAANYQSSATETATEDVTYTLSNVTQFVEATSSNWASTSDNHEQYSGGIAYRGVKKGNYKTMLTVAEAGVYSVIVAACNSNTGSGKEFDMSVYKNSTDVGNQIGETQSVNHSYSYINSTGTYTFTNIMLAANDKIILTSGNTTMVLDYVAIAKTGEYGTITDAGWSTFASSYPLNLSTISGGTAYYASAASGSTVTLTSTTATVPAGEGIMVKGTAGETFTINVAASGTAIPGNLLKGQTTTGNVDASNKNDNGKYHYIFGYSKSDATEYGFYNLTADTEVAAGKAYLETTTALTAGARLTIIFDDETTGISDASLLMDNGERKNDNFFNLNGQRVEKPAKGLYIVNGKKVVMK